MKRIIEFKSNLYPGHTFHVGLQQPILRTPDQMTEAEIKEFIAIVMDGPEYNEDTVITVNEIHCQPMGHEPEDEESFDAWGTEFTVRCFEGTIAMNAYGNLVLQETNAIENAGGDPHKAPVLPIFYHTQAVDYLRSIGIDCDGLLSNGLAIKDDRPAWTIDAEAKLSA